MNNFRRSVYPLAVLLLVALFALVLAGCGDTEPPAQPDATETAIENGFKGDEVDTPFQPSDFTLTDQHGQAVSLSDMRGHPVFMFFGYTKCPDFCPFTLSTWTQVEKSLGERAKNVRFVFITLDPERDTEAELRRHVGQFSDDFIGLRGDKAALEPVYEEFDIYYEKIESKTSEAGYLMSHTVFIFLLDKDGVVRVQYLFGDGPEVMTHDAKMLLDDDGGEL